MKAAGRTMTDRRYYTIRARHACDIVVLNQEYLSPEEELVADLLTITHVVSARLSGLRPYRKKTSGGARCRR